MVEFAVVAPVFFLLLIAICQFGYLMYAYLSLQHAVSEAARFGITGQRGMPDSARPPMGQSGRSYSIRKMIVDRTPGVNHDPSVFRIELTQLAADSARIPIERDGMQDEGDMGGYTFTETLIVQAHYSHPFFIPLFGRFNVPIDVRASMRNEQWRYGPR